MTTLFSKLHDQITSAVRSIGIVKKQTILKRNFTEELKFLSERCHTVSGILSALTSSGSSLANAIYAKKNDPSYEGCTIYINISADLKKSIDTKQAFTTIAAAAKAIETVIANFEANVDIIFEGGNDLNIHTAKLSHIAMFGFVERAEMFVKYFIDLFSIITYELVETNGHQELDKPLPYRYKYISDNYSSFVEFVSDVIDGGHKTYLASFKSLKSSVHDIRLANSETGSNIQMLEDSKLLQISNGLFGSFSLNPFKWLGEIWVLMRNNHYVQMNAEKEDLLAHVALLQMKIGEMDPNSDEYRKLVKVINNYNLMIAKLQQKLDQYYNEE